MISIVDYGAGNISALSRLISHLGRSSTTVTSKGEVMGAKKLILPGVGNFDFGMRSISERGIGLALLEKLANERIPVLGICLGMQLLCKNSEEGNLDGLGLIDASVKKFDFAPNSGLKIPHMGWNTIHAVKENPLLPISQEERRYYFVHSYKVVPNDPAITIATADYGGEFCAAFQKDNIFGVQFHPEKSHRFGLELIKRFIEL